MWLKNVDEKRLIFLSFSDEEDRMVVLK